jgi:hypothetical protein
VSNFSYYMAWLAAGLVVIAIISALIARHLRLRVLRRVKSGELLNALAGYSDWVTSQRHCTFFQGEPPEVELALQELELNLVELFPELAIPTRDLFVVHQRVIDFLHAQQTMRLEDPEAWLVSEHDSRFTELWRQHLAVSQTLAKRLHEVVVAEDAKQAAGSIFPA